VSQEGMQRIKAKLQELAALIKEETFEQRKEIKDELLSGLNQIRTAVEGKFQVVNEKYGDNIVQIIGELENKAQKAQRTIQDKVSKTVKKYKRSR
jgi:DNA anti-recombination protein RmuC